MKEDEKIINVSRQDFGSVYTDLIKKLHHHVVDGSYPIHDHLSGQLIARSGCTCLPSAGVYIFQKVSIFSLPIKPHC